MTADSKAAQPTPRAAFHFGCRLAALLFAGAAIGLPVNQLFTYALLLAAAVLIYTGEMTDRPGRWLAAAGVVALAVLLRVFLTPPQIEEGHNLFLPGGPGVLEKQLPREVYRFMQGEFDARYPPARRCDPKSSGCWLSGRFPDRAYAFSADGVMGKPAFSRTVSGIDFSDAVWLRFGFINDVRYNWYGEGGLDRGERDRRFWMGWQRWHITMPWYVMYQFPANYTGAQLCWRGDALWEGAGERYEILRHAATACRTLKEADIGKKVFGVAIKPDSLAMKLEPAMLADAQQTGRGVTMLVAVAGIILLLVRVRWRATAGPFALIALALLVISVDDASFIGGMRPFDGGDDGLFYDSLGRTILQQMMAGDIYGALQGGENVFYYGGPGLRYLRALEHLVFGETYLGYLTLVLLLPFVAFAIFRRFLDERWALALLLIFVALPLGELFGTAFFHYAKWAARGFADPAAYIFFLCGILLLIGRAAKGPSEKFAPAFWAAFMLAMAIFIKPIIAPAAAALLGGAGLAALYWRQWPRLAGLCIGFLPVFSMALHNRVYGGVFVLFSENASLSILLVMPPSAYLAALWELLTFNFVGGQAVRALLHIARWLAGPSEFFFLVPLHAAAVAVLVYVTIWGRTFDPWLRLIAAAALAQHGVALFYIATPRYHFLTWFMTMVVSAAWIEAIATQWLWRRYPEFCRRAANSHPATRLASALARLQRMIA